MTNYPSDFDNLTDPTPTDSMATLSHAQQHAQVNDAMEAVQHALGLLPQGASADVAQRIQDTIDQASSETSRAQGAEGTIVADYTSQITDLAERLNQAVPGFYTPTETVLADTVRAYGGSEFVALQNIPKGIPPTPLGDGTDADKAILLAGRAGFALSHAVTGGQAHATFEVNTTADTGAGSFRQAIADAKAAGGGYIIWDPAGGSSGTYVHTFTTYLMVPSNVTINAWAPVVAGHPPVKFQGFGANDNMSFSIGGLTYHDFQDYYLEVPAENIIVSGINFHSNVGFQEGHGDVSSIRWFARRIWFDHCEFTNENQFSDGAADNANCDAITYTWCKTWRHHKPSLTNANPVVYPPTGSIFPPGYSYASPGPYIPQTISGQQSFQNRVTYVHCLWSANAQRNPESSHRGYVHVAGCHVRMFGAYNDGTNAKAAEEGHATDTPPGTGLYNWPWYSESSFGSSEYDEEAHRLAGPSTGPGLPNTPVAGAFHTNSGSGTKSISGGRLLVEGSNYLADSLNTTATNKAIQEDGDAKAILETRGNIYTNCDAEADTARGGTFPVPPYALALVPVADLPTTTRYGAGVKGTAYWQYVGPAEAGSSFVVRQNSTAVGAAKELNFTGAGFDTLTFDSGTKTVTVPSLVGAVDPTTILLWGTLGARPAASAGNVGKYYWGTDTTVLYQCYDATHWRALTGPITPIVHAGQEIAAVSYHPTGGQTTATTTSTTLIDVTALTVAAGTIATQWTSGSAAMFDVTFTVPPSGVIDYMFYARWACAGGSGSDISMALYDITNSAAITNTTLPLTNTTSKLACVYRKQITGLTPGASLTYRPQVKIGGNTVNLFAGAATGNIQIRVTAST